LCQLHSSKGSSFETFVDFDSLNQKEKDRVIEDFATSKSEAHAAITYNQVDVFDTFFGFFDAKASG
jgi:hypothetical protein